MKSKFLNKGRTIYFKNIGLNHFSYDCSGEYIGYNEETNEIYLKCNRSYFVGNLSTKGKIKCRMVTSYLDHKIIQKDLTGLDLELFIGSLIRRYGYGETENSMRYYVQYLFNKLDKKIIFAINKGFLLL
jgi:hypothetical protein